MTDRNLPGAPLAWCQDYAAAFTAPRPKPTPLPVPELQGWCEVMHDAFAPPQRTAWWSRLVAWWRS